MPSIKVLAISPYPGMVPLLTETAKEYDGLELTISVGDLAKGLELAQKGFHANFEVIISRGGTARLLKPSVSLPVIEIGTTEETSIEQLPHHIEFDRVAVLGDPKWGQRRGIAGRTGRKPGIMVMQRRVGHLISPGCRDSGRCAGETPCHRARSQSDGYSRPRAPVAKARGRCRRNS